MKREKAKKILGGLGNIYIYILNGLLLLAAVFCTALGREAPRQENAQSVPVLGYHHLAADADKWRTYPFDPWTSSLSSFERQMQYLYENGYQTISLDDFYAWYKGEKSLDNKTVLLTFDDSYYSTVALAKPILQKYGFQASVFVIGKSIPAEMTEYAAPEKSHIPAPLLKSDATLQFYSHFYDLHRKINGVYAVHAYEQPAILTDILRAGKEVSTDYMAYPYGEFNDRAQTACRQAGVRLAFSYNQWSDAQRTDGCYALPRYSVHAYTPMFLFRHFLNHD